MKYIVGNWKTNGDAELLARFQNLLGERVILCVPFNLLAPGLGAQNCSASADGDADEVSAKMIAQAGAKYCIVGHPHRRQEFGETNEVVATKARQCLANGITPIICVGESKRGESMSVIDDQVWQSIPNVKDIKGEIIIAYEPVWAIGTGLTPTSVEIESMLGHIAKILKQMNLEKTAILYGGSVKANNAREILALQNVGGVLVGGASLDVEQFKEIINAGK